MSISALPPAVPGFTTANSEPRLGRPNRQTPIESNSQPDNTNAANAPSQAKPETQDNAGKPVSKAKTTELSDEQRTLVAKLKARDLEVRQHESAHLAVAGALATSGASFTFQKGPDGVNYAIGGEVGIDVSPGRTPQETIERARIVQAAALAPAEPSGPDLAVAAQAQQLQLQAQAELAQQQSQQNQDQNQQPKRRNEVNRAYGVGNQTISGLLNVFA